ncbi:MAG TPA: hypothetical protein PL033_06315 [Candidatus Brocadiia bacterium]|nr:hypothetical protein [Candidatus Brocadiia bacterium]
MAKTNQTVQKQPRELLIALLYFAIAIFLMAAAAPLARMAIGLGIDLENPENAATAAILRAFRIVCFCAGMWMLMWAFRHVVSSFVPYASDIVKNKLAWGCFLVGVTVILAPVTAGVARGIMTGRASLGVNECLLAFCWMGSLAVSVALLIKGWKQARGQAHESTTSDATAA